MLHRASALCTLRVACVAFVVTLLTGAQNQQATRRFGRELATGHGSRAYRVQLRRASSNTTTKGGPRRQLLRTQEQSMALSDSSSGVQAFANLLKCMVGSGILTLPYVTAKVGLASVKHDPTPQDMAEVI